MGGYQARIAFCPPPVDPFDCQHSKRNGTHKAECAVSVAFLGDGKEGHRPKTPDAQLAPQGNRFAHYGNGLKRDIFDRRGPRGRFLPQSRAVRQAGTRQSHRGPCTLCADIDACPGLADGQARAAFAQIDFQAGQQLHAFSETKPHIRPPYADSISTSGKRCFIRA